MARSRAQQAAIAVSKKASKKPKMKDGGPIGKVASNLLESAYTSAAFAASKNAPKKLNNNTSTNLLKEQDAIIKQQDLKNAKLDAAYYKQQAEHLKKVQAAYPNSKKIAVLKKAYNTDASAALKALKTLANKKKGGIIKNKTNGKVTGMAKKRR